MLGRALLPHAYSRARGVCYLVRRFFRISDVYQAGAALEVRSTRYICTAIPGGFLDPWIRLSFDLTILMKASSGSSHGVLEAQTSTGTLLLAGAA